MRLVQLSIGIIGYLTAIASLLALFGFIAGVGPQGGINDGPTVSLGCALAIDTGLIALFGIHHSGAARRQFKSWFERLFPPALERSVYLLTTSAIVALIILGWHPIPITLWAIVDPVAVTIIRIGFLGVMAMMLLATFQIGHLNFFGLRKPLDAHLTIRTPPLAFSNRLLYGLVRHPISLGWLLAPWLVAEFTVGQLVFALGTAVYIVIVTPLEEADSRREIGPAYEAYRAKVPGLLPLPKVRKPTSRRS